MKTFLIKLIPFLLIIAVYFSIDIFYFCLTRNAIPAYQASCVFNKDPRNNAYTLNIIGCSNLEYNINYEKVRSLIPDYNINFYYFSASQNSSYLNFLVKNIAKKEGDKFLLYMPYELYKRSNTFAEKPYFYTSVVSKSYLSFLARENPFILFGEKWRKLYEEVKEKSYEPSESNFRNYDLHMDSLKIDTSSYSTCKSIFIREKHLVGKPEFYTKNDGDFINSLFGKSNYAILLSPIPNIPEHSLKPGENIDSIFEINHLNRPLNSYKSILYDTTYFYDQWYHLNKCGNEKATNDLIASLNNSALKKMFTK